MYTNEKIKELRRNKQISQEKLAALTNVSRQAVTKWENGTSIPDSKHLMQLAEIFHVSIEELTGDNHKYGTPVHQKEICQYCGKPATYYSDKNYEFAYCSYRCEQLHKHVLAQDKNNLKWFLIGILISLILMLGGAFVPLPVRETIPVGAGLAFAGTTLVLFPFCTPESFQRYGYVKTVRLGRALGMLTEIFGLCMMFLF